MEMFTFVLSDMTVLEDFSRHHHAMVVLFLAPSGAQEVAMSVRSFGRPVQVCLLDL